MTLLLVRDWLVVYLRVHIIHNLKNIFSYIYIHLFHARYLHNVISRYVTVNNGQTLIQKGLGS